MNLQELLERNGIDTNSHTISYFSLPEKIFFLEEDYLKKCCLLAGLTDDLAEEVLLFAAEIKKDPVLRQLAWHLHRLFCSLPEFKMPPDHIDVTGPRTGILYLIIFFSLYEPLKNHLSLWDLPLEQADKAMMRLTPILSFRGIHYPGEKGLLGRSLPYVLHYKNNMCFRIGRFDFILTKVPGHYPELFRERKSGKYKLLCRNNWNIAENGFLLPASETPEESAEFIEAENCCTGRVIDPVSGLVTKEVASLDLSEYDRLLHPDANVLQMHIPGGGKMALETCKATFIEAKKFFSEHFPSVPIAAIGCVSWIFNPAWRSYLPESNISRLQYSTLAFPFQAVPKSGLFFIFGRDDGEAADYPADNSMRKAMLQAWKDDQLRSAGMLLPFNDIENFPLDPGK